MVRIVNLNCSNNLVGLEAELGSVFFIINMLLCLTFPMVQESGHSNLSRVSYGHLNIYCSYGHFSRSNILLPGFKPTLGHVRFSFWAGSLHKKCGKLS